MPSEDLLAAPAIELARLIREGVASSAEVVGTHLDRIAEVNPVLNAVVQFAPDALRRAAAADEAVARGDAVGPLHGVPFTVKNWIEVEGLVCAAGFEERVDFVPRRDAAVVARMRDAGAILLGKTNVTHGEPVYARPNNPHELDRVPGSSSSGEAAIIAAGGSPFGLASDSGGSIRWPAHCTGVVGLKPSTGLVPNTGHFPRIGHLADPRTAIEPIARSARDLEATGGDEGGVLRWELASEGDGCVLTFTHTLMPDRRPQNSVLAGWHFLHDQLPEALAGRPTDWHALEDTRTEHSHIARIEEIY